MQPRPPLQQDGAFTSPTQITSAVSVISGPTMLELFCCATARLQAKGLEVFNCASSLVDRGHPQGEGVCLTPGLVSLRVTGSWGRFEVSDLQNIQVRFNSAPNRSS